MLCLAQGPCQVLCVGSSEIFLLGNPGALSALGSGLEQELDLQQLLLCRWKHSWVAARAGMLLCLQHHGNGYLHPEWEQTEPGMSCLLLLLCGSCSPKEM